MIIVCLLIIYIIYVVVSLIFSFLVKKYGKISYDGLTFAGFKYDFKNDMFIAVEDSWQRNFGYGHIYDVLAPLVNVIIDTESIYFKHKDYNYLIAFWKGQYGMVTGAEVGVYRTKDELVNNKTIYEKCDTDISMSFELYNKDEKIIDVRNKTWWLAAFKLGMFSKPKDLTMDIWITFPDEEFLNSFLKGFRNLGYKGNDYKVIGSTFIFSFKKPKTKKVFTRTFLREYVAQKSNKKKVKAYSKYLKNYLDNNGVDDSNNNEFILVSKIVDKLLGDTYEEN